jgi:predicted thioredoxin/glutaredoxin
VTEASPLVLLTREDCGLCEEFLAELEAFGAQRPLPRLELRDVDADPETRRRYGLDIPVLLLDGERVCAHRFDPEELERLLRPRG